MRLLARIFAASGLVLALLYSVVTTYFSSEVLAVPDNQVVAVPRQAGRVLLVVVDGLRYDTALVRGEMPVLMQRATQGASGLSLATTVTMTGVGVRTIGTGSSPGLSDLLSNIELPPVRFDNPLARVAARGGRVALVGDRPAWMGQFGASVTLDQTAKNESLTLLFADNVDGPDRLWTKSAVSLMARHDWELAIVMLGGIDHASHRWGPGSERFRQKARRTDEDLRRILDAAGPETTVVLTSDHGTADTGHHGSGEPLARRSPLVILGPHIAHGVRLEARQTDLAATLAVLLGVPLPAASEGRVLTEALAIDEPTRHAIEVENARQQRLYAEVYARAHRVAPPQISADRDGLYAFTSWLEAQRIAASWLPAAWALALVALAISLVRDEPASRAWWIVGALAFSSLALGAHGAVVPAFAAGGALVASFLERPSLPLRWIIALAGCELLVAAWRIHNRAVELALLHPHVRLVSLPMRWTLVAAILLAPIAWMLRRSAWGGERWQLLVTLLLLSAGGDTLALPLGIGAGIVALVCFAEETLVPIGAVVAAIGAALVLPRAGWATTHLEIVAPAALACAAWSTTRLRIPLLVLVASASLVLALGLPPLLMRALVGAALVGVPVVALRLDERLGREWIVWAAAIGIVTLSSGAQAPSVLCWTLAAMAIGRLAIVREGSDRGVLAATLACICIRLGFLGLFEGGFGIDQLEISVGYLGNPGTEHVFGALLVVTKLVLPFYVSLVAVTLDMPAAARNTVFVAFSGFWFLRIGHVVLSMTVARGTFYSPWADAGHLLFMFLMVGGTALSVASVAALRRLRTTRAYAGNGST